MGGGGGGRAGGGDATADGTAATPHDSHPLLPFCVCFFFPYFSFSCVMRQLLPLSLANVSLVFFVSALFVSALFVSAPFMSTPFVSALFGD